MYLKYFVSEFYLPVFYSFSSTAYLTMLFTCNCLNTRRFDSKFLYFQISCAPPCLFLQSLMGNYDVTEATVSISGIKIITYMLLMHIWLKHLRLYCKIFLCGPHFKICDNTVTSQITINKTWWVGGKNLN